MLARVKKIFATTMVFVYLFLGVYLITFPIDNILFTPTMRYTFGTVVILYGIFRGYTVYLKHYTKKHEND
jgi:hypothetical protein